MILTTTNPALVPCEIIAAEQDGTPDTTITSGTVRAYHLNAAGAEVVDLAATPLVNAAPIWRYAWQPVALADGNYFVEYTLAAGAVTYAPITEDLTVRAEGGGGGGLTAQQTCDAVLTLTPTAPGGAGTLDKRVIDIGAKTTNLPTDPADQSAIEAAITAATSPLATSVALATVDGVVDAIKLKTDNLPSDPADQSAVEAAILASETAIRGADGDTLKTLGDQIDGISGGGGTVFKVSCADDGSMVRFVAWGEADNQPQTIATASAVIRDRTGATVVNLGAGTGPSGSKTFRWECATSLIAVGEPLFFDLTATGTGGPWYAKVGFARS